MRLFIGSGSSRLPGWIALNVIPKLPNAFFKSEAHVSVVDSDVDRPRPNENDHTSHFHALFDRRNQVVREGTRPMQFKKQTPDELQANCTPEKEHRGYQERGPCFYRETG